MDIKLIAKPLAFVLFADSGCLFDRRVAFRSAREAPFGPPGRAPAGFRWLRGRAELHQKRRNDAVDPDRCQAAGGVVAALPGQPQRSATQHARRASLSWVKAATTSPTSAGVRLLAG